MGSSRGIIAIVISLVFFVVWYTVIVPKFWPEKEGVKTEVVSGVNTVSVENEDVAKTEKLVDKAVQKKEVIKEVFSRLDGKNFIAEFSNYGAVPVRWDLKTYTVQDDSLKKPVFMVPSKRLSEMPLQISFEDSDFYYPKDAMYELIEEGRGVLKYRWASKEVAIEKEFSLGDTGYDVNLDITITNLSKSSVDEKLSIGWSASINPSKKGGFLSFLKRPSDIKIPIYLLNNKVEKENNPAKIEEMELKSGNVYWTGIEDRYFLAAILPREQGVDLGVKLAKFNENKTDNFYSGIVFPEDSISKGLNKVYKFSVYAGPKEMHLLKSMGRELDKAIDYGWFTVIAVPILYVLKFLHSIVHNYGIAIILLTIMIKILLYPISKKSMKSMKAMKDLQPAIKALRDKYKDNKERLNVEMMQLFKSRKVNPMSGCLPMVLQFPVYIALYRVLWNSIELYQTPFFWFYKDLSQADPYYIMPVLLGVAMFVQQKMTPTATADPAQQKMMMMMPLMFSVFLAFLPVGLVLYILVNTLITILQQWMNNNDIRLRDLLRGRIRVKSVI